MVQESHQLQVASNRPVSSAIAVDTLLPEELTESQTQPDPSEAVGPGWSIRKTLSWRGQLSCLLLTV